MNKENYKYFDSNGGFAHNQWQIITEEVAHVLSMPMPIFFNKFTSSGTLGLCKTSLESFSQW